jgi:hypothetical protein
MQNSISALGATGDLDRNKEKNTYIFCIVEFCGLKIQNVNRSLKREERF